MAIGPDYVTMSDGARVTLPIFVVMVTVPVVAPFGTATMIHLALSLVAVVP
jgi:hypothetical protein